MDKKLKCCLCGCCIVPDYNGWAGGHNAEPVVDGGRCCRECNDQVVIPYRIVLSYRHHNKSNPDAG